MIFQSKKATVPFRKGWKFAACTVAASVLFSSFALVSAANVASVVKAVNCLGYQFVQGSGGAPNQLKIFFDKGLYNFNANQIAITKDSDHSAVAFTAATAGGSGWSNSAAPGGTTVILTPSSGYSINNSTEYDIDVSSTVQMGNSYHQSVGEYLKHSDIQFQVYTPDAGGSYGTHTPQLSYLPRAQGGGTVGESSNAEIISDIPLSASLTSQVYLQEKVGSTWQNVGVDSNFSNHTQITDDQCYTTQINDAGTCIFIPETLGGQGTPSYNFDSNADYQLVFPSTIDGVHSSFEFLTGAQNPASLGNISVSVTGTTASSVSLQWSNITAADASGALPDHYEVWYSTTSPYFGFSLADTISYNSTSTSTDTIGGLSFGNTYYFRIVPVYSNQEGGFSAYVAQAL